MEIDEELRYGIGLLLNEATFIDARLSADLSQALVRLDLLSWDEVNDEPAYPQVVLVLEPVGRVLASLRDEQSEESPTGVVPIHVDELGEYTRALGPRAIYGWKFIDVGDIATTAWARRPSLDVRLSSEGHRHRIALFKEWCGSNQDFDLWIWFDDLSLVDAQGRSLDLEVLIRRADRWWGAMRAGDERTSTTGIYPLPREPEDRTRGRLDRIKEQASRWIRRLR